MEKTIRAGGQTDKQGSLYFQLKHCCLKRKCLKTVILVCIAWSHARKVIFMTTVLQGTKKRHVKVMDLRDKIDHGNP